MSHGRLSDDRLARAAAHGEPDAFGEIYSRYHGVVYGYCLSLLHDPEDARDALQNTMEKALGAIASQRVTGGLKAWLLSIAHNEAISLTRRRPATQPIADEPAMAATASDPAVRERLAQLVQDLETLPDRQRSALVLRELSGLGSAEIGSALGISPAAANQAVYEARATLLAQSGGRDMQCGQVQTKLSDSDGRGRRGRRLKAHLADCALCSAFAAAIPARRADMQLLFPPLGAALAAKTLTAATAAGGAAAAGGGAAGGGGAGGGAAHGAGAAGKGSKGQLAGAGTLAAVIAAVVVGALALGSPEPDPARPPPAEAAAAQPPPAKAAKKHSGAQPRPTAPVADSRPPAAVAGYSDLGPGVLGTLGGSGQGTNYGAGTASAGPSGAAGGGRDGGGSLPFTGLDLVLLALAGAALVGTGGGLRRLARAPRL